MKNRAATLVLCLFIALLIMSCGYEENNTESQNAFKSTSLTRDPSQIPPTLNENFTLTLGDQQLLLKIQPSNLFSLTRSILISQAGISQSVQFIIDDDFADGGLMPSGGITGHNFFSVDGKLAIILSEVANYFALFEIGATTESKVSAINRITIYHNSQLGLLAENIYPTSILLSDYPAEILKKADFYFRSMMGAISYHEFGHYYLYHALDRLRVFGTPLEPIYYYTTANEDASDYIAGVLTKKAGFDLAKGQLMFDIMSFYVLNRQGILFTFSDVENSLLLQLGQTSQTYSSLGVRKQNYENGFNSF